MWVPEVLGRVGACGPVDSLEVIANVSYGDASAGWVLMAACLSIGTGAAYLADEAVEQIFVGAERVPVIAGQGTRPGVAKTTEGGYLLGGHGASPPASSTDRTSTRSPSSRRRANRASSSCPSRRRR